jgi:hypothetical protein
VSYEPGRVVPPELIRMLPDRRALVVRGNLSPVVVKLRMAWKRRDYGRARRGSALPVQPGRRAGLIRPDSEPELDEGAAGVLAGSEPWWLVDDLGVATGPLARPVGSHVDDASGDVGWQDGHAPLPEMPAGEQPTRPRRPWDPPVDDDGGQ